MNKYRIDIQETDGRTGLITIPWLELELRATDLGAAIDALRGELGLEAAKDGGWTYTADELPQDGEYVIASFPGFFGVVTCKYTDGWYRSNNIPVPGLPYGWQPLPHPAALRTAASEQEPTP